MAEHPGYLLPDGDAYTDELACCLVFYPDKPEYRRALLGSLVYLSTWIAWERDSEKRGKDAARAWKNAVEETLECWTMTCLEELIADVATIRNLLETKKDCCDENTTYYPTEEPTTEIVPGEGDAPEFYGETAIEDWDEWNQHVCFNAHAYVDYLVSSSSNLYDAVQLSAIYLGVIAAALALLAFTGIGLPIAFGTAAAIVAGLALGATGSTFLNTAEDFEAARDDIVCAIMLGASLPDAVETALSSGTDWDLFYQFVDYDSAVAILYEGGWGAEFLPTETREDCGDCEDPPDFNGFELWVGPAIVQSDQSIAPPSCNELYVEDYEYYTTINECAVPFEGKVHLEGYVTVIGTMQTNTNCEGAMWLKFGIRVSMATNCEEVADQGDTTIFYNETTVTSGAKDLVLPYDFTTVADFPERKTLCLELRTWIRSGSHDLECINYLTLIEEGV